MERKSLSSSGGRVILRLSHSSCGGNLKRLVTRNSRLSKELTTLPHPQPNIIVFFTDQQRWDTAGCYGNQCGLTPNLDRLAEDGVRFEHAFTCQPVCGPARASLQTGKYATATGCYRNDIPLPLNEKTLAHYLREAGYEAGYIGKWHLAGTKTGPVPMERRGGYVNYWLAADILEFTSHPYGGKLYDIDNRPVEFENYRVDFLTDQAIDYLRTRDGQKPFFLFLSYLEPHHQNDLNRYVAPHGYAEKYRTCPVPPDLAGHAGDWRENLPDYFGICKRIDENLGRIIAELKALHLEENTVLFFTSDHGSHFRTRNSEYKRSCHEASIRIPMVINGPNFKGGKVAPELVSLIDLPPTILETGGVTVPGLMQGRSVLPLVRGETGDWPGEVFVQISESQVGRAIRTRRWKYGVDAPEKDGWDDSGSEGYVEQYLYDLENDPNEQNNLIGHPDFRAVADGLAAVLKRRMVAAGEKEPEIFKK